MQIKLTTDYTIRLMLFLATKHPGVPIPGKEIAVSTGISANYLNKVVTRLRVVGLIHSDKGTLGGFSLARRPEDITLYEVLSAAEDTLKINRCLEDPRLCSRGAAPQCKVHQCLSGLQTQLEDYLSHVKLSDLL